MKKFYSLLILINILILIFVIFIKINMENKVIVIETKNNIITTDQKFKTEFLNQCITNENNVSFCYCVYDEVLDKNGLDRFVYLSQYQKQTFKKPNEYKDAEMRCVDHLN